MKRARLRPRRWRPETHSRGCATTCSRESSNSTSNRRPGGLDEEEEYHQERVALKRRALTVLRTLDEQTTLLAEADHTIERAVDAARARRMPQAAQPASTKDDTWWGRSGARGAGIAPRPAGARRAGGP